MKNTRLHFRQATVEDLASIVKMLADDPLGVKRELFSEPLLPAYTSAFDAIAKDPNNELSVACLGAEVVGVLQLTYIPYLTYQGSWRALVEGVRVSESYRAQGIGQQLFEWAIERARAKGCRMVQLTTDKARPEALRFYERLGFKASHEGMKLHFENNHSSA